MALRTLTQEVGIGEDLYLGLCEDALARRLADPVLPQSVVPVDLGTTLIRRAFTTEGRPNSLIGFEVAVNAEYGVSWDDTALVWAYEAPPEERAR